MARWESDEPAPAIRIGTIGWFRALCRGGAVAAVTFGGLAVLLLLRLPEMAFHGRHRPWTPWITQAVCRMDLALLGIAVRVQGQPLNHGGVVVANHASWLDIFALNAVQRVCFVAKSEVRGWAGIGWLARATGTVFIRRDRREASRQQGLIRDRLAEGHQLLFFPEGTSTDGLRVLPFKTTLFDAFAGTDLIRVQAVSVAWTAPPDADARFYGWWGDMELGTHLLAVLAAGRQGHVTLVYHPPVRAADHPDRKTLARLLERQVRDGQPLAEGRTA